MTTSKGILKNSPEFNPAGSEITITDQIKLPLFPATYYQQKQLIASVSNPVFLFNIQKIKHEQYSNGGRSRAFVRMPYDQLGGNNNGEPSTTTGPMWNTIREEFSTILEQFKESQVLPELDIIINAIEKCNPIGSKFVGNFDVLRAFFQTSENEMFQNNNMKALLHMIEQALALPEIIPHPIPLLQQGDNKTIVMTQQQVFSLLSNAFLCTFGLEPRHFPEINFFRLHGSNTTSKRITFNEIKIEKLKCIFNYFYQMYLRNNFELWSHGKVVTFERRCLAEHEIPNWAQSYKGLSDVEININGKIEDCGKEMLQVDFANQFVGGAVLGDGALEEEIRFSICPELIVSRLFTEKLSDEEVLVITGCEQFSQYEGYGQSFTYTGPYEDPANTDNMGRISTELVAMDALKFYPNRKWEQFSMRNINRELNKAYTAFMLRSPTAPRIPIASGNWGCESFNGDPELKFLIQWLAASQTERKFVMFVFTHHEQANSIEDVVIFLKRHRVTVGTLYKILQICSQEIVREHYRGPRLFHMIQNDIRCLKLLSGTPADGNSFEQDGRHNNSNIRRGRRTGPRRGQKRNDVCSLV